MTSSTGGEFQGKTVEEAIESGLAALGLKKDQVTIEILSKGSRGLLGFGAEDARVLITPKQIDQPSKPPVPPAEPATKAPAPQAVKAPEPAPKAPPAPKPQRPAETDLAVAPTEEAAEELDVPSIAREILQGMLDRMDVKARAEIVEPRLTVEPGQEPPLVLNIEGEDLGILIGRRGETLAALQYLVRLMVNHRIHRWTNLVVDVEGYKARREDQLRSLAERMADRATKSGRAVALEAMPPAERRIIHITLRNHPHVTTQSVGEGEHRKVTIIPKD